MVGLWNARTAVVVATYYYDMFTFQYSNINLCVRSPYMREEEEKEVAPCLISGDNYTQRIIHSNVGD